MPYAGAYPTAGNPRISPWKLVSADDVRIIKTQDGDEAYVTLPRHLAHCWLLERAQMKGHPLPAPLQFAQCTDSLCCLQARSNVRGAAYASATYSRSRSDTGGSSKGNCCCALCKARPTWASGSKLKGSNGGNAARCVIAPTWQQSPIRASWRTAPAARWGTKGPSHASPRSASQAE